MEYFIGIVPPEDYPQKIVTFQKRWANNLLYTVVEPHMTVNAQGGLSANMSWLEQIQEVCRTFPRFQVSLTEAKSLGTAVVYLGIPDNLGHGTVGVYRNMSDYGWMIEALMHNRGDYS